MLILAADTSTESMGVALWQNGSLIAETVLRIGLKHAVTFMPAVRSILSQAGIEPQAVDAFACTTGPGSFTGIRIGVSAVKAMAYAAGKPAYGFSTLAVLAAAFESDKNCIICPMLDARNDRIYASAWLAGGELVRENNWRIPDFFAAVRSACGSSLENRTIFLVGSGKIAISRNQLLPEDLNLEQSAAYYDSPRPAVIAAMAENMLASGIEGNPDMLLPSYLGLSQAERLSGERKNDKK